MKRPRKPANFSQSLHDRLNMYALAASAAGVGVVALAQSAEAKIVYTPAHHVIGLKQRYALALNHKFADFLFTNTQCVGTSWPCTSVAWASLAVVSASSKGTKIPNEVVGGQHWASALKRGAHISQGQEFSRSADMAAQYASFGRSGTTGPWVNVTDRYLGLRFKIGGKLHYGWARFNVTVVKGKFEIVATLTGYAYETIPNKPIIAGKTNGPDVVAQPATLGSLALGRK